MVSFLLKYQQKAEMYFNWKEDFHRGNVPAFINTYVQ